LRKALVKKWTSVQFHVIWIALMMWSVPGTSDGFLCICRFHSLLTWSPSKLWSDHSLVLSIEQFLICKSASRLSQVAHYLNGVLCRIYENTPERWRKDVKFKVKKWAKWRMD